MIVKRIIIFVLLGTIILLGSFLVIQLGKGYRPDFSRKTFHPTGLLAATSIPNGAQVFINGKLKSATNNTLSLSPGEYQVEIKKDGYSSWKKTLQIKKEVVVETDAYLFPLVPDLKALTFTGALNPSLSPDGTKVVYAVSESESVSKDGVWVLDLPELPFGRTREPRQIVKTSTQGRDFAKATFAWSPDSKQILVTLPLKTSTSKKEENFLIDQGSLTSANLLIDITQNLETIRKQWQEEEAKRKNQQLRKLPKELIKIIESSTKDISFSPDETKILYTATASATLKEGLGPKLPTSSTQKQERTLKPNHIYTYDIKQDRNFLIMEEKEGTKISWFPTSKHLFVVEEGKVQIVEYDSTNWTTVYNGPFENSYAFPWPDGNKILVLTLLSKEENAQPNLYAVSLR